MQTSACPFFHLRFALSTLHPHPVPFPPKSASVNLPCLFAASPFPSTSNLVAPRSFSGNSLTWLNRRRMTMAEFSHSGSGGGSNAFEQEAFIDEGSSLFPPNYIPARGFETILNRMSKWVVATTFGGVILLRHDAQALWAAAGSVLNVLLSTTLKQILNQERPLSTLTSGPGMPSSHAQSIFYAVVFVIFSMVEWLGPTVLATILSGLVLALGLYFTWLRVALHYHTISQVVVGALMGTIFSLSWFWTWDAIVIHAYNSYLWVRIVVLLGGACFSLGFIVYAIRYWIKYEN